MTIMVDTQRALTGGVDTHADVHVAAVIDPQGGLLGVESFATTLAGYKLLSGWMGAFGEIGLVGVEGTGSYGAGLARHLRREGLMVVEVDRPNRQERSRAGKSDALDAIEAARAAQSGRAFGVAKTRDGNVEAIRALTVARRSARESRTKAMNQIRQLVYTAPDELRERFVGSALVAHCRRGRNPARARRRSIPCAWRPRAPSAPSVVERWRSVKRASASMP